MKVHPVPRSTIIYASAVANGCRQKKLRRLPHIFEKFLELPFHSDSDVSIHETLDSLKFTAATDDVIGGVTADVVEIYPGGVTKIVIRGDGVADSSGTEFELDLWRFRLPNCTRPELASATYDAAAGDLVVTVPKGPDEPENDDDVGGARRLLLV